MELGFQAAVQRNFIGSRGGGVHLVRRGRRRWIGRQSSLHRATSQLEVEDDDLPERYRGRVLVGWSAGLGLVGCGQVSVSLFFSASFLFFYLLFSVLRFLIQVLICFCRF
jgi:hypothetical protein